MLKFQEKQVIFSFYFLVNTSDFLLFENIYDSAGERLDGIDSEAAAQRLRGNAGTTVTVKVHSVIISVYVNISIIELLSYASDRCFWIAFEMLISFIGYSSIFNFIFYSGWRLGSDIKHHCLKN